MQQDRLLPEDAAERKTYPIYRGLFRYFPDALAAVAHVSWVGNEQHHPGTDLHWDKSKSSDEPDAMLRHVLEGEDDLHARAQAAWRALAWLQRGIDEQRAPAESTQRSISKMKESDHAAG